MSSAFIKHTVVLMILPGTYAWRVTICVGVRPLVLTAFADMKSALFPVDHHRPASDLYAETQLFGDSSPVKHELVKAMRGTSPVEEDDITPEIVLSGDDTRVVPSAQWTNFLGWQKDHAQRVTSEYEQDDETRPTRSETGHRRTTSPRRFETEKNPPGSKVKVKTEQVEPTRSSPVKTLAVPIKLEIAQPSQTRKKAPTSKPKAERAEPMS